MEPGKVSLLSAHMQGDQRAFEQLVRTHADSLFGYLMRICGNRQNAEDLFQQSFMKVHQRADTFKAHGNFKSWLFTIATHLAIDAARKEKRDKKLLDDYAHNHPSRSTLQQNNPGRTGHPTFLTLSRNVADAVSVDYDEQNKCNPLKLAHLSEQKRLVRKALLQLPAGQRSAVVLTYYQGLTYKEAAHVLGCSLGTVKTQIFRALRKLAKLLPEGQGV